MTNVEKMRRYIELTGVTYGPSSPYQMSIGEMMDLCALAKSSPMDALVLAFNYGRAKGERHARA